VTGAPENVPRLRKLQNSGRERRQARFRSHSWEESTLPAAWMNSNS
jgi:hypothetical protein